MQSKDIHSAFPEFISFTVTNSCNLRCRMCGQWSDEGYVANQTTDTQQRMRLEDWIRLVDEIAQHRIRFILVRGGEPFLFKGIMDLLKYINAKGISLSVDTNGTLIDRFADELSSISNMHITFSVDGPEEVHDDVRKLKGSYTKIRNNIALLLDLEWAKSAIVPRTPARASSFGVSPLRSQVYLRTAGMTPRETLVSL